jgi:hypothetical protein
MEKSQDSPAITARIVLNSFTEIALKLILRKQPHAQLVGEVFKKSI